MAAYLAIFKALHVVGFVAWFAGLFYLVRILIYHSEAMEKSEPDRSVLIDQFKLMEQRVYKIICNPAMMTTWLFGIGMLIWNRAYLELPWMHLKLTLVVLFTVYHIYCKYLMNKMAKGERPVSTYMLRVLNEGGTLFLVAIAFIAVLGIKNQLNYLYYGVGLILFAILILLGIRKYRKTSAVESES